MPPLQNKHKGNRMEDFKWAFGLLRVNNKPDYFFKTLPEDISILYYTVKKGFWKMLHTQICLWLKKRKNLVKFVEPRILQIYLPPLFFTNTVLTFCESDASQNTQIRKMLV